MSPERSVSPFLSVVTTSYSAARWKDVRDLLDTFQAQSYRPLEVIVVVERAADLAQLIVDYWPKTSDIRLSVLLYTGVLGADAARNAGINAAEGAIIAVVDDDTILAPDWAEQMVRSYDDDSIVGVTGPSLPQWMDEGMSWFPAEFSWMIGCTTWNEAVAAHTIRNVGGMNCSFRREAFESAGLYCVGLGYWQSEQSGWHQVAGEEVELSLRIQARTGKRIIFNPCVQLWHKVRPNRLSFAFLAKRAYRMGYSKHMIRRMYATVFLDRGILSMESYVVGRILTQLIPSILVEFTSRPRIAIHRLRVTFLGLVFAALGYVAYYFKPFVPDSPPPFGGREFRQEQASFSTAKRPHWEGRAVPLPHGEVNTFHMNEQSSTPQAREIRSERPVPSALFRIIDLYVSWLRPRIPTSALHSALRAIDNSVTSILDVGCGKGGSMLSFRRRHPKVWTVGIDLFWPYLTECRLLRTHHDLVCGDVRHLPFQDKSFDMVLCVEVLEHLDRGDGLGLLEAMERIARKKVILTTPVGRFQQAMYNGNPHQQHRYIWSPAEMRRRGYFVLGHGIRHIGPLAHPQSLPLILHPLIHLIWGFAGFATRYLPDLGADMTCIKSITEATTSEDASSASSITLS